MHKPQFHSVDSSPARLAHPLVPWSAPILLIIFSTLASALLLALHDIPFLHKLFPSGDLVLAPYDGTHSIPLRIFILSFYISFALTVASSITTRLALMVELVGIYTMACVIIDMAAIFSSETWGVFISLHAIEILSGGIGFMFFSLKLLDIGTMPEKEPAPYRYHPRRLSWIRLWVAIVLAAWISFSISSLDISLIDDLRAIALLGGIGPGVFLFLPLLFLILYIWGTVLSLIHRRKPFFPDLTIIVPAHNEAHVIGRTLAAIEAAAMNYDGRVEVLVLDNASSDDTASAAREALLTLPLIKGRIISVPTPGKAIALNRGVAETHTRYLVRIDADTQILPDTLKNAMCHFSDPKTGVVGGMPLPPGTGPFDRARLLEILLKHGYYQVAYGAIDGIIGIPGMFAAYRIEALRLAGGFVQGMNGEDTDASLRIGEMGYRIVGDPNVEYVSEVPVTYAHMREQRIRWFRSVYHVASRNRDYLSGRGSSLRGKAVLPFMLLNSSRRTMTVPLLIFGILNLLLVNDPDSPLTHPEVIAVILGAPALMAAFAALANGRIDALLGLPEYLIFRIMRSYLTLESMLSIAFDAPIIMKNPG